MAGLGSQPSRPRTRFGPLSYRAAHGGRSVSTRRYAAERGVLMPRSARVAVVVLTVLLSAGATTASADAPKLKGAVGDPRGDASHGFGTGEAPDVKRVSVTYDPAAGVIEWRIAMWSPVPSFFMFKAVSATVDCTPASPSVFHLERAAVFPLRVTGIGAVQNVVFERVIDGAHMTET